MAALQKQKIKNASPKIKNKDRKPGHWLMLHNSRGAGREIVRRNPMNGINGYDLGLVGSAAYRRRLAKLR